MISGDRDNQIEGHVELELPGDIVDKLEVRARQRSMTMAELLQLFLDRADADGERELPEEEYERGQLLVAGGPVFQEEVSALFEQRMSADSHLVDALEGGELPGRERMERLVGMRTRLPEIQLSELDPPEDVSSYLPEKVIRTHDILPIARSEQVLIVTQVPPMKAHSIRYLREKTGKKILPVRCSEEGIRTAMKEWFHIDTAGKGTGKKDQPATAQREGSGGVRDVEPISGRVAESRVRQDSNSIRDHRKDTVSGDGPVRVIPIHTNTRTDHD